MEIIPNVNLHVQLSMEQLDYSLPTTKHVLQHVSTETSQMQLRPFVKPMEQFHPQIVNSRLSLQTRLATHAPPPVCPLSSRMEHFALPLALLPQSTFRLTTLHAVPTAQLASSRTTPL
jgi:hypothetical protein